MDPTHRQPVATVAELVTLDDADMNDGYFNGFSGEPCGDNRSRSYWHGWRNGMMDKGRMEKDDAACALAHEVIAIGFLEPKH